MVKILSLGAGVQSSTLLGMACFGEIERPDAVIFADTGWEPKPVYEWFEFLKDMARKHDIPLHVVSQGNIREDALVSQVRGTKAEGKRFASMPLFIKKVWREEDIPLLNQVIEERLEKDQKIDVYNKILLQIVNKGEFIQRGMISRQCTYEYKIRPLEKVQRKIAGYEPRKRIPPGTIETWKGISTDEQKRATISAKKWISFYYPLIEMRMRRSDCIAWFKAKNLPEPPRSACVGCPFRHNDEWIWLQENSLEDFEDAVFVDKAIRHCGGMRGEVYLHADRIPLDEVVFDKKTKQRSLFDDECAGVCGV